MANEIIELMRYLSAKDQVKLEQERSDQRMALELLRMQETRDLQEKSIELEASKSMYRDNMQERKDLQKSLDALELEYGKAVGSLDLLPDLYKGSGKDVTTDIYKGEASNYTARAEWALDQASAIENKIDVLQETIYGDVKRAQNIMAGGASFEGGADPEAWDLSDLGIVSYEAKYGKASPTVEALFANNPGLMTASLASLQKTEESLKSSQSKRMYYDFTGTSKQLKQDNAHSNLILGSLINKGIKLSGKQQLDGFSLLKANLDASDANQAAQIDLYDEQSFMLRKNIGSEFAELLGINITDEMSYEYSQEYFDMLESASGASEVRQGQTAYGDYSAFNKYVQQAKDNYVNAIKEGNSDKARRINELAIKYFGMPADKGLELTTYAMDVAEIYSNTYLSGLGGPNNENNIIGGESLNLENNLDNLDNLEGENWEELLD